MTETFYRNRAPLTPAQRAAQHLALYAHTLARLAPDLQTLYAHEYLVRIPLTNAVLACQIGGLPGDSWMAVAFAARDAVIAQHGGDTHIAQREDGQHVLVKNAPAAA